MFTSETLSMKWLIQATQLTHLFGAKVVLHDINFQIGRNEIVTVIGPNGSGKSTLVKLLIGLLKPSQGQVKRDQACKIGYVPQFRQLSETLPIQVQGYLALTGASQETLHQVAQQTQCDHLLHHAIQSLSGGEYQRVALARALLNHPTLLVLDEPAQGMDLMAQQHLYALLQKIREQYQCSILMISHDLHLVMRGSSQVICLNKHICCQGKAEAIVKDPAYIALFGEHLDQLAVYQHHHTPACEHEHGDPTTTPAKPSRFRPIKQPSTCGHPCDHPHGHLAPSQEKTL
jgi:zinc transport system ATP-binding protein